MIDAIAQAVHWIEGHPSIIAWLLGWLAGISAAQLVKLWLPVDVSDLTAKRMAQLAAVSWGACAAFLTWPATTPGRLVYALVIGMSAPLAYTWLRAAIAWKFPGVASRASRSSIVERKRHHENDDHDRGPGGGRVD